MWFYLTEISKYINFILMLLYTAECIYYEITEENYLACTGIVIRQRIYLLLVSVLSYGTLCLKTGNLDYIFLGLFVMIILMGTLTVASLIYPMVDKILLNNMVFLLSIGFIIISRLNFDKAFRQFWIVAVSIVLAMTIPWIIDRWKNIVSFQWVFAICGIMPLIIVLLFGTATHGSKISFTVAGITFQPSELVKILFVLAMAGLLSKAKTLSQLIPAVSVAACHVIILVISKDLGGGLVYFVCFVFMLFMATANYLYLGICLLGGAGGALIGYKMFAHVRVRVTAFLDPFANIEDQGFQISQSLFAINSGGIFGMGLMKGAPKDIPFVDRDFIFSAVCEEMGVGFGIGLLLVSFSCFLIMVRAGMNNRIKFYRLLSCGIAVLYIFQVFLTAGGNIKFIPLTGVTLPLVSYGGSSVLISIVCFFICQGVIILGRNIEYEEYLKNRELQERQKQEAEKYNRNRQSDEY